MKTKSRTKKGIRIEHASGKRLWAMKIKSQTRDRAWLASGKATPESMMLLRLESLRGAKIEWPRVPPNEAIAPVAKKRPSSRRKP